MTNLKHNKSVVAGDNYDQRVYHQDNGSRLNSRWRFVSNGDGTYTIYDMKQGKALVQAITATTTLTTTTLNGRLNARWKVRVPLSPSVSTTGMQNTSPI